MAIIRAKRSSDYPTIISFWYSKELDRVVPYEHQKGIMPISQVLELVEDLLECTEDLTDEMVEEANRLETARRAAEAYRQQRSQVKEVIAKRVDKGFVYLVQADGTNRCKIGKTTSLQSRLKQLEVASPYPLTLLHATPSNDITRLEAYFHERFNRFRVYSEWFELDQYAIAEFMNYEEVA